MHEKILLVDDDQNLVAAMERNLRLKVNLVTALSGEAGLAKMADEGPFAVIIADMQMPGMNGLQLLSEVLKLYPETVRLMLTGNADQRTPVEAVNNGQIFRFLSKPCPVDAVYLALQAGLQQYRLITAERELIEQTLNGCVKVLTDVLSLTDPLAFGRGETLRNYVRAYARSRSLLNAWELEIAAMLAQLGTITIPSAILEKSRAGQELTPMELEILTRVPRTGADLLAHIPRLEAVARIILYQHKHYDGSGFPADDVRGEDIPIGARILKVMMDLLELEVQKEPRGTALQNLQQRIGWYDPRVLDTTFACFDTYQLESSVKCLAQTVRVRDLRVGQVVQADIRTENGKILVPARSRITPVLLVRLANFAKFNPIQEPIYLEPQSETK